MKTIFKYPVAITGEQIIKIPLGAKILSVQTQGNAVCLWALVDKEQTIIKDREFKIFGTGHEVPSNILFTHEFVATVQTDGGGLVWHIFINK